MNRTLPLLLAALAAAMPLRADRPNLLSGPKAVPLTAETTTALVGADFDADGRSDLLVVHPTMSLAFHRGTGQGMFAAPVLTPVGHYGSSVAAADLNGDSQLDLAMDGSTANEVAVLLANADGTFRDVALLTLPGTVSAVAFGELNGDGRLDLAVSATDESGLNPSLIIYAGDGNGGFGGPAVTPISSTARKMVAADVNGDHDFDLVVADGSATQLYLGTGGGTFAAARHVIAGGHDAVAVDLNGDSHVDIASTDVNTNYVSVTFGRGDGTFGEPLQLAVPRGSDTLLTADMNGDASQDLLALTPSGSYVSILTNRNGGFDPARIFLARLGSSRIARGDYTGDGRIDLLTIGPDGLSVLPGTGDGAVRSPESQLLGPASPETYPDPQPQGLALADVNGDNLIDVVTTMVDEHLRTITVLPGLGHGRFGAPLISATGLEASYARVVFADFDRDSHLDAALAGFDELVVFHGRGDGSFVRGAASALLEPGPMTAGDFTNDGALDILVNSWRPVVHVNDGAGTFSANASAAEGLQERNVALHDLNRDGNLDVIQTSDVIFLGDGHGGLTRVIREPLVRDQTLAGAGDLNGDGFVDVVTQLTTKHLLIFDGRGDGTFDAPRWFPFDVDVCGLAAPWTSAVLHDVDGDADLDLAYGSTLLLGDGHGSFDSFEAIRGREMLSATAVADLDANGSDDLVLLNSEHAVVDVIRTAIEDSLAVPTDLSLTTSTPTAPFGSGAELKASVGFDPPYAHSGFVRFSGNGQNLGIATVQPDHTAMTNVWLLPRGTHTVTATLLRNDVYASSSGTVQVTIEQAEPLLQVYSPLPRVVKNVQFPINLFLGANVLGGTPPPTGTVTIHDGGRLLATLDPRFEMSFLTRLDTAGSHTIIARYGGDANYKPAEASHTLMVVEGVPSSVALAVSPASEVEPGVIVMFSATIAPAAAGGSVSFYAGASLLATIPVANGTATWETATLTRGTHRVRAEYTGDHTRQPSISQDVTITVAGGSGKRRAVRAR